MGIYSFILPQLILLRIVNLPLQMPTPLDPLHLSVFSLGRLCVKGYSAI